MRLSFFLIISFISFSVKASEDTLKVLFIGNSITYYNAMPELFESIAENQGHQVDVTMHAPGGTGFVNHFEDPTVFQLLRSLQWDVVVLQPGTGESAGASYPVETTIERGQVLMDSIYQYSPCARVYLYQIPYGVVSQADYSNYFSVQTVIKNVITQLADALEVQVIPAGESAREYYTLHQNLLLHNAYGDIHPSLAGSFLTASTAYSTIFQDSILDCSYYSSLVQDTANQFFSIAENKVLNHLAEWRINTYNLQADFSFALSANTTVFTSLASNNSNVLWDFGDGTTSTELNPTHTYTFDGIYTVILSAYNVNGCVESTKKTINLITSGLIEKEYDYHLIAYPNPASEYIEFTTNEPITRVQIFNLAGERLLAIEGNRVDTAKLPDGMYIAEVFVKELPIRITFAKN
jgi:predicted secreted protein